VFADSGYAKPAAANLKDFTDGEDGSAIFDGRQVLRFANASLEVRAQFAELLVEVCAAFELSIRLRWRKRV